MTMKTRSSEGSGVNQLQLDVRNNLDFSAGLRAMLSSGPRRHLIGEMRDDETAHIGIRAALTGVLVFSTIMHPTLRAPWATFTTSRFPLFALNTLLAVISSAPSQICPYCLRSTSSQPRISSRCWASIPASTKACSFPKGQGCPSCFQTGYLGRRDFRDHGDQRYLRELIFQQISRRPRSGRVRHGTANVEAKRGVDKVLRAPPPWRSLPGRSM